MSIDVNWESATSGPDGEALAERIRSFIHDKFQQVALPRFIRSVQVHSFDFGTVAPELEIKDFCEPFADFYEEDDVDSESSDEASSNEKQEEQQHHHHHQWPGPHHHHSELNDTNPFHSDGSSSMNHSHLSGFYSDFNNNNNNQHPPSPALRSPIAFGEHLNPHFLPRAGTPGILGGTFNLGHHLMSFGGLSGTQTPLAAVAGGTPFASGFSDPGLGGSAVGTSRQKHLETDVDYSTPSRPSSAETHHSLGEGGGQSVVDDANVDGNQSRHQENREQENQQEGHLDPNHPPLLQQPQQPPLSATTAHHPLHPHLSQSPHMREHRPEDFQVLCHVKYSGDIRLCLTAEILLDYPMPSFVGLPLKLNVTGVSFDGVAIVAYIRKHVHFCFLSAEDAGALLGSDVRDNGSSGNGASGGIDHSGGLLREIRVDSEIGRKEDGKQVLKNVGKVERFVLAQVRRIFEEELVFPSFWTFLI